MFEVRWLESVLSTQDFSGLPGRSGSNGLGLRSGPHSRNNIGRRQRNPNIDRHGLRHQKSSAAVHSE